MRSSQRHANSSRSAPGAKGRGGVEAEAWYRTAFGPLVEQVYGHRHERDAARWIEQLAQSLGTKIGFHGGRGAPRVVDAGCGDGRFLRPLRALGLAPIGVDLSPVRLRALGRRRPSSVGVCADLRRLPLATGRADGVVSLFSSFGYLDGDGDTQVLSEFRRVVCPGARLLIDLPEPSELAGSLVRRSVRRVGGLRVAERRRLGPGPLLVKRVEVWRGADLVDRWVERLRVYGLSELAGMLAAAGFEAVEPVRLPPAAPRRLVVVARASDPAEAV